MKKLNIAALFMAIVVPVGVVYELAVPIIGLPHFSWALMVEGVYRLTVEAFQLVFVVETSWVSSLRSLLVLLGVLSLDLVLFLASAFAIVLFLMGWMEILSLAWLDSLLFWAKDIATSVVEEMPRLLSSVFFWCCGAAFFSAILSHQLEFSDGEFWIFLICAETVPVALWLLIWLGRSEVKIREK